MGYVASKARKRKRCISSHLQEKFVVPDVQTPALQFMRKRRRARDKREKIAPNLKAVQAPLLLFLVNSIHPLLQVSPRNFRILPLLPLLLNCMNGPSVFLFWFVLQFLNLSLEICCTSTPGITIGLNLVALALKIRERFFEGRGELLLGK
jgi:hypothetical protein